MTQMALGGVAFDGTQAASSGLVDFYSEEGAVVAADAFVQTLLADHAPGALVRTKRLLMGQTTDALQRELAVAAHTFEEAVHTDEARKGLDAFRRKEFVRWNTK
jgi:enoyl-CoA hydratase/carnithine racemase